MDFLTPHWYRVKPFALERADQFRPGPPPLVGSEQLKEEVDECIEFNANLTPEQKAIVALRELGGDVKIEEIQVAADVQAEMEKRVDLQFATRVNMHQRVVFETGETGWSRRLQ